MLAKSFGILEFRSFVKLCMVPISKFDIEQAKNFKPQTKVRIRKLAAETVQSENPLSLLKPASVLLIS